MGPLHIYSSYDLSNLTLMPHSQMNFSRAANFIPYVAGVAGSQAGRKIAECILIGWNSRRVMGCPTDIRYVKVSLSTLVGVWIRVE